MRLLAKLAIYSYKEIVTLSSVIITKVETYFAMWESWRSELSEAKVDFWRNSDLK